MKQFVRQFAVAAVALVVAGSARAAYVSETASLVVVTAAKAAQDYDAAASQLSLLDSNAGVPTQLEVKLVPTQDGLLLTYATNVQAPQANYSVLRSTRPVFLPEFPTVLAGLLLLVPLGASTLRILMKRSAP